MMGTKDLLLGSQFSVYFTQLTQTQGCITKAIDASKWCLTSGILCWLAHYISSFWQKHLECDFSCSYYEPKITTSESTLLRWKGTTQTLAVRATWEVGVDMYNNHTWHMVYWLHLVIWKRHSQILTSYSNIFRNSSEKYKYYLYKLWIELAKG